MYDKDWYSERVSVFSLKYKVYNSNTKRWIVGRLQFTGFNQLVMWKDDSRGYYSFVAIGNENTNGSDIRFSHYQQFWKDSALTDFDYDTTSTAIVSTVSRNAFLNNYGNGNFTQEFYDDWCGGTIYRVTYKLGVTADSLQTLDGKLTFECQEFICSNFNHMVVDSMCQDENFPNLSGTIDSLSLGYLKETDYNNGIYSWNPTPDNLVWYYNGCKVEFPNPDWGALAIDWTVEVTLNTDGEPYFKIKGVEQFPDYHQSVQIITRHVWAYEINYMESDTSAVVKETVKDIDLTDLRRSEFADSNVRSCYTDVLELLDYSAFTQWLNGLFDGLFSRNVEIRLQCQLKDTEIKSGECYFKINGAGEVTSYGCLVANLTDTVTIVDNRNGEGEGDGENGDTDDEHDDDNTVDEKENTPTVTSLGLLTSTYAVTQTQLKVLGQFLWDTGFLDNINMLLSSPIENLVSCKLFPFDLSTISTLGDDYKIVMGNVTTNATGKKIPNSYVQKVSCGSITIPNYYNSFLDYAPYTKISMYLPFCGFQELDVNEIIGKTIYLYYTFDLICGTCTAYITTDSYMIDHFTGTIGVDIPITSNNRASYESGIVSSVVGIAAGGIKDGVKGVASGALDAVNSAINGFHSKTKGSNSPSNALYETMQPYIIIDRPYYFNISSFNHVHGRACNNTYRIGNLTGFTVCEKSIDLSTIACTKEEELLLREILSTGFIV